MKSAVKAWLRKAEADADSARREYRARKRPNYDSACFHAQQCVEKEIKALREAASLPVRKVHDLTVLLSDCPGCESILRKMHDDLELLSQYAILFRYPGADATREQAQAAVQAMERCHAQLVKTLAQSVTRKRRSK